MYCRECGKQFSEDETFCTKCGAVISNPTNTPEKTLNIDMGNNLINYQYVESIEKHFRTLYVISGIIILFMIIIFIELLSIKDDVKNCNSNIYDVERAVHVVKGDVEDLLSRNY